MLHHREVIIGARTIDLIEPEGSFTGAEELLDEFDHRLGELLSRGRCDIRVGCRLVTAIDSAGIGVLVGAYTRARRQRGRFAVDPQGNEEIRRLLRTLGLGFGDDDPGHGTVGRPSPLIPPPDRGAPSDTREPERGGGGGDG